MADALENGAGYVRRLYQGQILHRAIERHYSSTLDTWTSERHANCDCSCPDCLRNYSNRSLHRLLDWRLALDLAELTLGRPLDEERWLGTAGEAASVFALLCRSAHLDIQVRDADSLVALVNDRGKALILSYPLWHPREGLANVRQQDAALALKADFGAQLSYEFVDLRDLHALPHKYILALRDPLS